MLKFPDDTQVRLMGLVEIMADLYSQGRQANEATADEIIKRLEAMKNYIPSADRVRKEFAYVLLEEYQIYVKSQTDNSPKHASDQNRPGR